MADSDTLPQKVVLRTTHCGEVNVFILGDYAQLTNKVVFLTVHDFGSNAQSFDKFIFHDSMVEVRPRSVWINFEVPGQGLKAPDLPSDFKFPSLQEIGEDLVEVLNQLHVQYIVGFGEGAGANILTRFAITYPTRVLGMMLVHPTATSAGFTEWVKDKLLSWKLKNVGVDPSAEDYLVLYKFGSYLCNFSPSLTQYWLAFSRKWMRTALVLQIMKDIPDYWLLKQWEVQELRIISSFAAGVSDSGSYILTVIYYFENQLFIQNFKQKPDWGSPPADCGSKRLRFDSFSKQMEKADVENREQVIQQYLADLRSKVNPKNLHAYMDAFLNRSDLSGQLRDRLTCDTIIVCGTKSSFQHTVVTMYSHLNPQKSSLLKIDNVGDALNEAPEQVTRGLLLFCKGLGLLTSVSTPAERARSVSTGPDGTPRRRMSMQEADLPRRLSVSRQEPI